MAFGVMRVLAIARLLWARRGALPFDCLASVVEAPLAEVEAAVMLLTVEGMVVADVDSGTVGLTERGARELGPWLDLDAVSAAPATAGV